MTQTIIQPSTQKFTTPFLAFSHVSMAPVNVQNVVGALSHIQRVTRMKKNTSGDLQWTS